MLSFNSISLRSVKVSAPSNFFDSVSFNTFCGGLFVFQSALTTRGAFVKLLELYSL
jgi:hypothetical protein